MIIESFYDELTEIPKRKEAVLDALGPHIGAVVTSYISDSIEIKQMQQLRRLRNARRQRSIRMNQKL